MGFGHGGTGRDRGLSTFLGPDLQASSGATLRDDHGPGALTSAEPAVQVGEASHSDSCRVLAQPGTRAAPGIRTSRH